MIFPCGWIWLSPAGGRPAHNNQGSAKITIFACGCLCRPHGKIKIWENNFQKNQSAGGSAASSSSSLLSSSPASADPNPALPLASGLPSGCTAGDAPPHRRIGGGKGGGGSGGLQGGGVGCGILRGWGGPAAHQIVLAIAAPPCTVGTRGEERTMGKMRRGEKEERREEKERERREERKWVAGKEMVDIFACGSLNRSARENRHISRAVHLRGRAIFPDTTSYGPFAI